MVADEQSNLMTVNLLRIWLRLHSSNYRNVAHTVSLSSLASRKAMVADEQSNLMTVNLLKVWLRLHSISVQTHYTNVHHVD